MAIGSEVKFKILGQFRVPGLCFCMLGQEWPGTGETGNWKSRTLAILPLSVQLRLIWGSAEPWGSPFLYLFYRWLDWVGPWGLLRLWHSESMNSQGHRTGASWSPRGKLTPVSLQRFRPLLPAPFRVQLPVVKLFKDSRPSAWGSFQLEVGLPSSLCKSLSHRLLGFAGH